MHESKCQMWSLTANWQSFKTKCNQTAYVIISKASGIQNLIFFCQLLQHRSPIPRTAAYYQASLFRIGLGKWQSSTHMQTSPHMSTNRTVHVPTTHTKPSPLTHSALSRQAGKVGDCCYSRSQKYFYGKICRKSQSNFYIQVKNQKND